MNGPQFLYREQLASHLRRARLLHQGLANGLQREKLYSGDNSWINSALKLTVEILLYLGVYLTMVRAIVIILCAN
jgi:hypothetical protein